MSEFGSSAVQTANSLSRQVLDMNEAKYTNWKLASMSYKNLNAAEASKRSGDEEKEATGDIAAMPKVVGTTVTLARAGKAGVMAGYHGATVGESALAAKKTLARAGGAAQFEGSAAEMGGVEGIVGGAVKSSFGKGLSETADAAAEVFAKGVGKSVGLAGAGITAVTDVSDLLQTGSIFDTKGADGKIEKGTTAQDIGNVMNIAGGVLDVFAAFSGGALAPIAAAVNIAAAAESTVANEEKDEADTSTDAKDPPSPKAPPQTNPVAFQQLGLLANQSHNPLNHIN